MKRGTPTGKHFASGSSFEKFPTRSLKVLRVHGRKGTSTCLSALFTPFHLVSARLLLKPGYHAPFPPKSGRPSGKCGAGPATAFGALSCSAPKPGRNGPGSLASGASGGCWAKPVASVRNATPTDNNPLTA